MVAHLKSENWGSSHSLPLSWVVGVIQNLHLGANLLDHLSSLHLRCLGRGNKSHQPGPRFPRFHHSGTYYPLCELSRAFVFHSFPSCWVSVILLLIRTPPTGVEEQRGKWRHYYVLLHARNSAKEAVGENFQSFDSIQVWRELMILITDLLPVFYDNPWCRVDL